MDRALRDKKTILLLILPALTCFLIFIPIPAIFSIILSFFKWNLIGDMKFIGLDNFQFLFIDDFVFRQALKNTFIFLGASIMLQLPMAFLLANLLIRNIKGQKFFRNIIFLPVTFSGVAVSLMWYFIYHPEIGLLNQFLSAIGLDNFRHAWLGESATALIAVTVSVAWQWVGYHMVIYIAGISAIPEELFESAKIDGANELQVTYHIVFPLLLPIIEVSMILITTSSLKSFDNVFVMTGGGPNHASEVLASHMYTKAFAQMSYGYGSSISTLLMGLCIAATVFLKKAFSIFQSQEGR